MDTKLPYTALDYNLPKDYLAEEDSCADRYSLCKKKQLKKHVCSSQYVHPYPQHAYTPSPLYLSSRNEGMRAALGPWGHQLPRE